MQQTVVAYLLTYKITREPAIGEFSGQIYLNSYRGAQQSPNHNTQSVLKTVLLVTNDSVAR